MPLYVSGLYRFEALRDDPLPMDYTCPKQLIPSSTMTAFQKKSRTMTERTAFQVRDFISYFHRVDTKYQDSFRMRCCRSVQALDGSAQFPIPVNRTSILTRIKCIAVELVLH